MGANEKAAATWHPEPRRCGLDRTELRRAWLLLAVLAAVLLAVAA